MRAPRWALALTTLAGVGTLALAVGVPTGSAAVVPAQVSGPARIEVSARGDAMYFEVNSASIPASPSNNASSLYAVTQLSSTGGGTATASTPFFGSTVQNLPGTANGVPPQFGLDGVAFPFTRLPGFINCRGDGEQEADLGYGRVAAKCSPDASEAHGSQGAPPGSPAPNQQESADAVTRVEDGTTIAEATGSVQGFVMGPLEVGNAVATAAIRDTASDGEPEITSATSGTFSVSGQQFGFTEQGITYAGEGMSQDDALEQANKTLEAAGIRIEVAPVTKNFDKVSGQISYTIGGLKITWAQQDAKIVYILCRASITSVNEALGGFSALGAGTTGQPGGTQNAASPAIDSDPAPAVPAEAVSDDAGTVPVDTGAASPSLSRPPVSSPALAGSSLSARPSVSRSSRWSSSLPSSGMSISTPSFSSSVPAASSPAESSDSTATVEAPVPAATPPVEAAPASESALGPMTLGGFTHTRGPGAGDDTQWLYLMIALGGVAVFGGQAAWSRLAVRRG